MKLPRQTLLFRTLSPAPDQSTVSVAASGYCGTSWHEPLVRDRWDAANFSDACEQHDRCYETCGRSKSDCDHEFERNMEAECRHAYPGGGIDYLRRNSCIGIANTYAVAVEHIGSGPYHDAQRRSSC